MPYDEWQIAADVDVWRASGDGEGKRILPDGCLDVLRIDGELFVAGPDTTARVHEGESHDVMGVRLHAGRGPALLGVPAHELRDQTVPLAAVWGDRRARVMADELRSPSELGDWALAVSEEDVLGRRLHTLLDGGSTISGAADQLGFSPRQLHRRAVPLFGYGLQHLGRILRLNRAVADGDTGVEWVDVAARAGYADQAHLARDFRALAGATPSALREERVRSVQAEVESRSLTSAA